MLMANLALVADIGGTNARFALVDMHEPATLTCVDTLATNDYLTLTDALDQYLKKHQVSNLAAITLAVAAPVQKGKAKFTNAPWLVDRTEIAAHYRCGRVQLINDFEAIALCLTELEQENFRQIGDRRFHWTETAHVGVIGVGTGLGAARLNLWAGQKHAAVCEAGHASFAPENERQQQILTFLSKMHTRVSYERLLSGSGIENIYSALSPSHSSINAEQVFNRWRTDEDEIARYTVEEFTKILGQFAGDYVLTTGCYDGIFLAGGVIVKQFASLEPSLFLEAFLNKGRHRELMSTVPTVVISHLQPGLIGAARATKMESANDFD